MLPSGDFLDDPVPVPTRNFAGWFHIVFNFIGPNDGQGFTVYHDGELVQNASRKRPIRNFPRNSRIVIGRFWTASDQLYSSLHMDELMFFNQPMTKEQVKMFSQ